MKPRVPNKQRIRRPTEPTITFGCGLDPRESRLEPIKVVLKAPLAAQAAQWRYALRNRSRWITNPDRRRDQDQRAAEGLHAIGVDAATLVALAGHRIVRVVFDRHALDTPGAVEFPWEYMLPAATREVRSGRRLVVIREIADDRPAPRGRRHDTAMLVESAPYPLRGLFNFEAETALVKATFESQRQAPKILATLQDPTRDALSAGIRECRPRVVHVAGIDSHQGRRLLRQDPAAGDGVVLTGEDNAAFVETADVFATVLTSGAVPPELVILNFYNTGMNLARLVVERGAGSALGVFDELDDSASEWLIANFYRHWLEHGGDVGEALLRSLVTLRDRGAALDGTGVVVWTRNPTAAVRPRELALPVKQASQLMKAAPTAALEATDVNVDVRVLSGLNYALLRNDKDLFSTFRLRNLSRNRIGNINVEVTLRMGNDAYPFQGLFDIDEPVRELRERIRVPLPSGAGLLGRENARGVIHTRVRSSGHVIHESTVPVTLQSIDEWQLDAESVPWLPAFVFPHDRAIEQVLDLASRNIRVIRREASFGFPGYQADAKAVDDQAWAIWAAIAYDIQPMYISPLPGGGLRAQRLRAPCDTLGNRRGTCVDLALLFAACLEYIEIYPVIFLLEGHAYAGYWRDVDAHARFCRAELPSGLGADRLDLAMPISTSGWVVGRACLAELRRYIAEGALRPLETQLLAERGNIDDGENATERTLEKLTGVIDVSLARAHGVSSLPFQFERKG